MIYAALFVLIIVAAWTHAVKIIYLLTYSPIVIIFERPKTSDYFYAYWLFKPLFQICGVREARVNRHWFRSI